MTKTRLLSVLTMMFMIVCPQAHAQEWAKTRLDKSSRHLEWVDVTSGDRTIKCFVAYPESKKKSTTVIVIHEIFGLSEWVREICDELAAEGFIAIAPDLLSGKPGQETANYASVDGARKAVSSLPRVQVAQDMLAVSEYGTKLPSANGKTATAGFCWGGTQTWLSATTNKNVKAAFVFYGTPDDSINNVSSIGAPVYGFYGENDNRVTSTVDDTVARMKAASKFYEPHIYADAAHGFMRTGESPDATPADQKARKDAWGVMTKVLNEL